MSKNNQNFLSGDKEELKNHNNNLTSISSHVAKTVCIVEEFKADRNKVHELNNQQEIEEPYLLHEYFFYHFYLKT